MGGHHPRTTVLVASFLVVAAGLVAAVAIGRSGQPPDGPVPVTAETFGLVREGMPESDVMAALGEPVRRTSSLAEGLVWPEPEDTCWYYGSVDGRREYQICFVAGAVKTRGSYPIVPEGGP